MSEREPEGGGTSCNANQRAKRALVDRDVGLLVMRPSRSKVSEPPGTVMDLPNRPAEIATARFHNGGFCVHAHVQCAPASRRRRVDAQNVLVSQLRHEFGSLTLGIQLRAGDQQRPARPVREIAQVRCVTAVGTVRSPASVARSAGATAAMI